MQYGAETLLAILNILLGIEDVEMPKVIHQARGHDWIRGVFKTQNEEAAILLSHPTGKIKRPAVAFFGIHGLDENWLQVQVRKDPLPFPAQAGCVREGFRSPWPAQLPGNPVEEPTPEAFSPMIDGPISLADGCMIYPS